MSLEFLVAQDLPNHRQFGVCVTARKVDTDKSADPGEGEGEQKQIRSPSHEVKTLDRRGRSGS